MSHYTLGVFTRKKIEKDAELAALMAPFWEGDGDETLARMSGYFVFCDQTEEYKKAYETESLRMLQDCDGIFHTVYAPESVGEQEDARIREYRLKDLYPTFEDYMAEEDILCNHNGRYGYWYNPNARYDYFTVGGRWDQTLITREGKRVNSAKVSEIDFPAMKEVALKNLPDLSEYIRHSYVKEAYLRELYPSEAEFRKCLSTFNTYAILTPEGVWIEEGTVGSFGLSSETVEERREWIKGYHKWLEEFKDCFLTILDCHI